MWCKTESYINLFLGWGQLLVNICETPGFKSSNYPQIVFVGFFFHAHENEFDCPIKLNHCQFKLQYLMMEQIAPCEVAGTSKFNIFTSIIDSEFKLEFKVLIRQVNYTPYTFHTFYI